MKQYAIMGLLLVVIVFEAESKLSRSKPPLLTASPCAEGIDAKKLGADYKAKLMEVGINQFTVIANGKFASVAELATTQQQTVDLSLREAYIPIADALTKQFGPTTSATNVEAIKAFYADLALGYRGAK